MTGTEGLDASNDHMLCRGSMHSKVQGGRRCVCVCVVECTLKNVHGLACLTEAVNKGCCWLDQTASTFWGKGLVLHGWGDWKAREAAWNPWTCRSGLLQWFWRGEKQPRWFAFWCLSAEDAMLLGKTESDLPAACLRVSYALLAFWGKSKEDWMRCWAVLSTERKRCLSEMALGNRLFWLTLHCFTLVLSSWWDKILKMYCCQHRSDRSFGSHSKPIHIESI